MGFFDETSDGYTYFGYSENDKHAAYQDPFGIYSYFEKDGITYSAQSINNLIKLWTYGLTAQVGKMFGARSTAGAGAKADKLSFTEHASGRALERGFTPDRIAEIMSKGV
ncbi:MAG: hypothetical protein KAR38_13405, partial [Calditrichia bacterium]|nr:hypothetical protein [Calditrichia bacterium]